MWKTTKEGDWENHNCGNFIDEIKHRLAIEEDDCLIENTIYAHMLSDRIDKGS